MDMTPCRIIQISDTHLYADPKRVLMGVNVTESLEAVIDLLHREAGHLDLMIHSGDASQDGDELAYIHLADMLKSFNVPIYWVPGNHDNTRVMAYIYPRETVSNHKHIVLKHWHIILLNSQKPGAVEGWLDLSQLNYLQHCLQAYPEHHAIIAFHHPPLTIDVPWLDKLGLKNASEFWELISHYPRVKAVLFGHVHQDIERVIKGVRCYSAPATCFQFARHQDHFELENTPPGYRWLDLYPQGHLETGVNRVDHYVGEFDAHAKGY
jgi:3',5'-cyclic-AMP phosphodiesterase